MPRTFKDLIRETAEGLMASPDVDEAEIEQNIYIGDNDGGVLMAKPAPAITRPTDYSATATVRLSMSRKESIQRGQSASNSHRRTDLIKVLGPFCQGCGADYTFDPRVLEVDHKNPRSQGGTDDEENLTLLCSPCNKLKSDRLTLKGLRQENRKHGHMKDAKRLR